MSSLKIFFKLSRTRVNESEKEVNFPIVGDF